MAQAYLSRPGEVDEELQRVITDHLLAGVDLHPGAALARLGIEWIVIVPGSEFPNEILERQLDLSLRPVDTELEVYQNTAFSTSIPVPGQGSASRLASTAGWGSGVLLIALVAAAYWGRNRRKAVPLEAPEPQPVPVA
jgi:hypothetical protein